MLSGILFLFLILPSSLCLSRISLVTLSSRSLHTCTFVLLPELWVSTTPHDNHNLLHVLSANCRPNQPWILALLGCWHCTWDHTYLCKGEVACLRSHSWGTVNRAHHQEYYHHDKKNDHYGKEGVSLSLPVRRFGNPDGEISMEGLLKKGPFSGHVSGLEGEFCLESDTDFWKETKRKVLE